MSHTNGTTTKPTPIDALAVATDLSRAFAGRADAADSAGRMPAEDIAELRASGYLALNVPVGVWRPGLGHGGQFGRPPDFGPGQRVHGPGGGHADADLRQCPGCRRLAPSHLRNLLPQGRGRGALQLRGQRTGYGQPVPGRQLPHKGRGQPWRVGLAHHRPQDLGHRRRTSGQSAGALHHRTAGYGALPRRLFGDQGHARHPLGADVAGLPQPAGQREPRPVSG